MDFSTQKPTSDGRSKRSLSTDSNEEQRAVKRQIREQIVEQYDEEENTTKYHGFTPINRPPLAMNSHLQTSLNREAVAQDPSANVDMSDSQSDASIPDYISDVDIDMEPHQGEDILSYCQRVGYVPVDTPLPTEVRCLKPFFGLQPVRRLQMNPLSSAGAWRPSLNGWANWYALLTQLTGLVADQPCEKCARGHTRWAECVVASTGETVNTVKGACGCCLYNNQGSTCSFAADYQNGPQTWPVRLGPPGSPVLPTPQPHRVLQDAAAINPSREAYRPPQIPLPRLGDRSYLSDGHPNHQGSQRFDSDWENARQTTRSREYKVAVGNPMDLDNKVNPVWYPRRQERQRCLFCHRTDHLGRPCPRRPSRRVLRHDSAISPTPRPSRNIPPASGFLKNGSTSFRVRKEDPFFADLYNPPHRTPSYNDANHPQEASPVYRPRSPPGHGMGAYHNEPRQSAKSLRGDAFTHDVYNPPRPGPSFETNRRPNRGLLSPFGPRSAALDISPRPAHPMSGRLHAMRAQVDDSQFNAAPAERESYASAQRDWYGPAQHNWRGPAQRELAHGQEQRREELMMSLVNNVADMAELTSKQSALLAQQCRSIVELQMLDRERRR